MPRHNPIAETFSDYPQYPAGCDWCPPRSASAQFRAHLHWLRDFPDAEGLKKHLYATMTVQDEMERANRLDSILQWYRNVQQDFEKQADADGYPLAVWEAWTLAQAQPPCGTRQDLHQRLGKVGLLRTDALGV